MEAHAQAVVHSGFHLYAAIAVFLVVYAILVWDKINRAVVALLGAGAVVISGVQDQETAVLGIDFNTIGLLVGMMIIVNICQKTGMFQFLAIKSAKAVKGEPWRMLVALACVTAILSAFLDNVTTVLLVTPLTLLIVDEMKLSPYPFLVSQILASNIGGTATLIGDPPNIMIGSAADLSFMDFVWNVAPAMPIVMLVTFAPLKFIYGRHMKVDDAVKRKVLEFDEYAALKDRALLWKCLLVLAAVVAGFVLQERLELRPATIAMAGAAVLLLVSAHNFDAVMEKLEWTTIFFFIGLFVVVHGLVEVGVIKALATRALELTGGDLVITTYLILWVSAVASAFVDNIPFVATMIPMIHDMGDAFGGAHKVEVLWWALSIGACLGGNGTIIGASANVIIAGMAHKAGHPISFIKFFFLAFPLMLLSIIVCTIYMLIRY
jgi:Na+/H+ antiporter NhaD/arsenite permease-like protein